MNFSRGIRRQYSFSWLQKDGSGVVPNLSATVHSAVQEFDQLVSNYVIVQAHTARKRQS